MLSCAIAEIPYTLSGDRLLKIAHGTQRKSKDGREWFWNGPTKRWKLTDEYKARRDEERKKTRKRKRNPRAGGDHAESNRKTIEQGHALLDALDGDDIPDKLKALGELFEADPPDGGIDKIASEAEKSSKSHVTSKDLQKIKDEATGDKMPHLAEMPPLDALNEIVKFPVNSQKRLQKLVDDQLQELKDLGLDALFWVHHSIAKGFMRDMKDALEDDDGLRGKARRLVRDRLERIYKGRISTDEAKLAALNKRFYELIHPRKLIRVPKGTTQREYYDIVSRLAAEDRKAIKEYTVMRPKGYKTAPQRKALSEEKKRGKGKKRKGRDMTKCLLGGVRYWLVGDRLIKASGEQLSLWDSSEHPRDAKGRFIKKMRGALPRAIAALDSGADKLNDKIQSMPISKLRDFDVDGMLNDNHYLRALGHLETAGRKDESDDSQPEIDSILDAGDEHFPELDSQYTEHYNRLEAAAQARLEAHDEQVDSILEDEENQLHSLAATLVDDVMTDDDAGLAEVKAAKSRLTELHSQALERATQKLNDIGAERDRLVELRGTLKTVLNEYLEALDESDWDEDLSKALMLNGVSYLLRGDRLIKASKKPVEGQLSLWDESQHPRDEAGKFTSGDGSSHSATAAGHTNTETAKKKISKRIDTQSREGKPTKAEVEEYNLDPKHPGIAYDESDYTEYLKAHREGNLGTHLRDEYISDMHEEHNWAMQIKMSSDAIAHMDMSGIVRSASERLSKFPSLKELKQEIGEIEGRSAKSPADLVKNYVDAYITMNQWEMRDVEREDREAGYTDTEKDNEDYRYYANKLKRLKASLEDESKLRRLLRRNLASFSEDRDDEYFAELATLVAQAVNWDDVGQHVASHLKLDEAIAYEDQRGFEGFSLTKCVLNGVGYVLVGDRLIKASKKPVEGQLSLLDGGWDESQHPRDKEGQFASKNDSNKKSSVISVSAEKQRAAFESLFDRFVGQPLLGDESYDASFSLGRIKTGLSDDSKFDKYLARLFKNIGFEDDEFLDAVGAPDDEEKEVKFQDFSFDKASLRAELQEKYHPVIEAAIKFRRKAYKVVDESIEFMRENNIRYKKHPRYGYVLSEHPDTLEVDKVTSRYELKNAREWLSILENISTVEESDLEYLRRHIASHEKRANQEIPKGEDVLTKFAGVYYRLTRDRLIKSSVGDTITRNGKTYQLNQNHRWQRLKHIGHEAAHAADHLGESVVSWKAGKIIGGAIASLATAAGADPLGAEIMSETVIQAGTAAALHHAKQSREGKASARDTAAYFVAQAAAAFMGKVAHHGAEWGLENTGVDHAYQQVGAIFSGKGAGIGTVTAANRSGVAARVVDHVVDRGRHDLKFLEAAFTGGLRKAAEYPPETIRLFWDLTAAAAAIALHEMHDGSVSHHDNLGKSADLKRVMWWNRIPIGISHEVGDRRHGRKMKACYGHIRGSYGDAEDGMSLDIYVGRDLGSQKVFKIRQVRPNTGELDEYKYVIGVHSQTEAKELYLQHMPKRFFGGCETVMSNELVKYRKHL